MAQIWTINMTRTITLSELKMGMSSSVLKNIIKIITYTHTAHRRMFGTFTFTPTQFNLFSYKKAGQKNEIFSLVKQNKT